MKKAVRNDGFFLPQRALRFTQRALSFYKMKVRKVLSLALRTLRFYKFTEIKNLCVLCGKKKESFEAFNAPIFQVNCKMICWDFMHKFIEDNKK